MAPWAAIDKRAAADSSGRAATGAGVPIAGTAGHPGRFTARQFSFDLSWQADRHIQIDVGNVDFTYLSAAYKF